MTLWDIRTLRAGSDEWTHLQVHGTEGMPVWNADVKAVVIEDGSLLITSLNGLVTDLLIDKPRA